MIHALLAACIASSSQTSCRTGELASGTYKILAADSTHRTTFTATASNATTSEHEALLEPYYGDATCMRLGPIDGRFGLFPGGSHDVQGELGSSQALCVKVYKGLVSINLAPSNVQSDVTLESRTASFHSLASACSVHATRLHCAPTVLSTGTYRIETATSDDVQVGIAFIGGKHLPDADGRISTQVDLSKPAGEAHLFFSGATCGQKAPKAKTPLLDQAFHDGGQESTNTVINSGSTLCVSILGTITLATP